MQSNSMLKFSWLLALACVLLATGCAGDDRPPAGPANTAELSASADVKGSIDPLAKGNDNNQQQQQQPQQQQQLNASATASLGTGENQGQSNSGAGLVEKLGDAAKKAKDLVKDGAKEVKDDVKTVMGVNGFNSKSNDGKSNNGNSNNNGGASSTGGTGGFSVGGSVKIGDSTVGGNMQIGASAKADASANMPTSKPEAVKSESSLSKLVQKVQEKASEFATKLGVSGGDKANASANIGAGNNNNNNNGGGGGVGGGGNNGGGGANNGGGGSVNANAQLKLNANGAGISGSANANANLGATSGANFGANSGANGGFNGNSQVNENKSLAVDLADKLHEVAKAPVEAVMKPIDKALGLDKDPLIKMYDDSHELIRKPLSVVAKPVESIVTGAFKTSEEAKQEQERTMNDQERREMRMKEERSRKEGRSVLGEIADRAVDLAEKPYEIIFGPLDKLLGLDKDGQKNPLIKLFEEVYNISKKPIDVFAKPLENILKKMAEGDQAAYQVSVRINSGGTESTDPKLFTRLADGALNIADRMVTKPLEVVMRPLGYDGQKKKNPIVESTHQLKNATKLGLELFTRPIDRIVKEISDIGANKSAAERESERERRRQEASRLVKVLDKLNQAAQMPWEIVLRPVSRVFGYGKEGKREPFLRAWDIIHQVVRTPIQVVSKPVEDAILGEQKQQAGQRAGMKAEVKIGSKIGVSGQVQIGASGGAAAGSAGSASGGSQDNEEHKKNIFVDGIKKIEKFAAKPFDKITSPIRRLILGEDDKVGSGIRAKATINTPNMKVQANAQLGKSSSSGGPDKLVKTIEKMNNVLLKPLEAVSQPISDLLSSEGKDKKGTDAKVQAQAQLQVNGPQGQGKASASAQIKGGNMNNGKSGGSGGSASGSANANASGSSNGGAMNMSASAAAQMKGNNNNGNGGGNNGNGNNNGGNSDNGQNKMSASAAASAQLKKN